MPQQAREAGLVLLASTLLLLRFAGAPVRAQPLPCEADAEAAHARFMSLLEEPPNKVADGIEKAGKAIADGKLDKALDELVDAGEDVEKEADKGHIGASQRRVLLQLIDDLLVVLNDCNGTPRPLHFTVRSADGENRLFWLNPTFDYGATVIRFRTDTFPVDAGDGDLLAVVAGTAGAVDSISHDGLENGTTYYYSAFVDDGAGTFSPPRRSFGRPDGSGHLRWSHTVEGQGTPAGVFPSRSYAVASFEALHQLTPGALGGFWPAGWTPPTLEALTPARPLPLFLDPASIGGASHIVVSSSLAGHVQAIDGDTGGVLWVSEELGTSVPNTPNGLFRDFGAPADLFLASAEQEDGSSVVYGLDLSGTVTWSFDNGGGKDAIGPIGHGGWVDIGAGAFYFTSERLGKGKGKKGKGKGKGKGKKGTDDTAWRLAFTETGASLDWSVPVGDVSAAPTRSGPNTVYVANLDGEVLALSASDGTPLWPQPHATGDGPVKGLVWPDRLNARFFVVTDSSVQAVADTPSGATLLWSVSLPDPSVPLVGAGAIWVGTGDGRFCGIDVDTGGPPGCVWLGDPAKPKRAGAATLDVREGLVLVPTDDGVLHALAFPPF